MKTYEFTLDNITVIQELPFVVNERGLWVYGGAFDDLYLRHIDLPDDGLAVNIEITRDDLNTALAYSTDVAGWSVCLTDKSSKPYAWMLENTDETTLLATTPAEYAKAYAALVYHQAIALTWGYAVISVESVVESYTQTTDYRLAVRALTQAWPENKWESDYAIITMSPDKRHVAVKLTKEGRAELRHLRKTGKCNFVGWVCELLDNQLGNGWYLDSEDGSQVYLFYDDSWYVESIWPMYQNEQVLGVWASLDTIQALQLGFTWEFSYSGDAETYGHPADSWE